VRLGAMLGWRTGFGGPRGAVLNGPARLIRPRRTSALSLFFSFLCSFLFLIRILFEVYNFTQDSNLGFELKCTYKNSA
jgi:hypothetical protein